MRSPHYYLFQIPGNGFFRFQGRIHHRSACHQQLSGAFRYSRHFRFSHGCSPPEAFQRPQPFSAGTGIRKHHYDHDPISGHCHGEARKRPKGTAVEEYLTVRELSQRIKLSKQTIYNFIHDKKFTIGKHYLKPTPKKILFKWSQIEVWLGETSANHKECASLGLPDMVPPTSAQEPEPPKSLIRI